jgi:hypothetical protein
VYGVNARLLRSEKIVAPALDCKPTPQLEILLRHRAIQSVHDVEDDSWVRPLAREFLRFAEFKL